MTDIRSYTELIKWNSFEDRVKYLMLHGQVGSATFGFDRHINQKFYTSREWKMVRDYVITRDNGCDLACPGHEIWGALLIHHINPIAVQDIISHSEWILEPEYLITTTQNTHNAIHFSDINQIMPPFADRKPGDTKLW